MMGGFDDGFEDDDDLLFSDELKGRLPDASNIENNIMSFVLIYDDRAVIGSFRYYKREKNLADVEMRLPLDVVFQELDALEVPSRRRVNTFEIHRGDKAVYMLEDGKIVAFAIDEVEYQEGYAKLILKLDFATAKQPKVLND